ncbi:MAG: PhoPQ-activated protein PqaA family protein [Acidobacteriia bacterium]|nr:PhoPQ-activated protein PqaA family protein [Terriglobia bacterium]
MPLLIPSPAGRLEALLTEPKVFRGEWAFALCHPHPQFGGSMRTKAIFRSARALQALGMATLQFNFRGVGESSGEYDEGRGEKEDVHAAVDFLQQRFPKCRLGLLGFSFGSWVGFQAGVSDDRIVQLVGLGIPIRISDFSFLSECRTPKLIIQGSLDEFGPPDDLQKWFESMAEPKQLTWVEGSTHLFEGKIRELQQALIDYFVGRYGMPFVNPI